MNGKELKELRLNKGLTQTQLAEITGIPQGTIGRLESTGQDITKVGMLNKFLEIFKNEENKPPANFTKLHSPQKGQTFYKALPQTPVLEAKPIRLADPFGYEATNDKIYQLPDESLIMQVPVIPYKAWASYLRGHADPEFYDGLSTMPVPVDAAHKGTYLIFEVGGESMLNPGSRKCIWPGEKIIGRDLNKDKWKYKLHINTTDVWVIVHRERGIVVKEIIAHDVDNGKITLHSWNPDKNEHPDYTVSLNDVEQIFNVVDPFNRFG